MFQFLRNIFFAAMAVMMSSGAAYSEDLDSASSIAVGCRTIFACEPPATCQTGAPLDNPAAWAHLISINRLIGECTGRMAALTYMDDRICFPEGVTRGQSIRVVVQYIDNHPARLHERFEKLALEALRAAWPCKK